MPTVYSLIIHFSFFVGGQSLHLSTAQYKNGYGEPFTIDQCKYYVSAIRVIGDHGETQTVLDQSHLVDAADSGTLTLHLTASIPAITKILFTIGVDSSANSGGVQTGDLDPMLGMFWTWNTGYVYARLEGISDSAHAPAHRFTWDVGGYRPGVDATREVVLSLDGHSGHEIDIRSDLLRWFDGHHPIHLSQSPICHQPGALAMQLADNYATMFSIAP
jgi:hypothetical protein